MLCLLFNFDNIFVLCIVLEIHFRYVPIMYVIVDQKTLHTSEAALAKTQARYFWKQVTLCVYYSCITITNL